jgi:gamma-glutamyltranspeptidase / glutathione hydrolase
MTSTSYPLSTQAAVDILQSGNNAADAAPAVCPVQAIVEVEKPISD